MTSIQLFQTAQKKKYLFFSDKNRHQVEFALYLRAPELKTYDYDYRSNLKKKESAEQCELNDNLNNMPENLVQS